MTVYTVYFVTLNKLIKKLIKTGKATLFSRSQASAPKCISQALFRTVGNPSFLY
ncbi:hypothetical protein GGTG_04640 [Gaeumannomyces tritici R3-111a-1]|uniref:Uncharacterized protein n=1 Tax=Gaeumannomyces tritici (strain R3-111a-1) TaxID=644352 RepID=J3NTP0_GAET3|nr:hypothetical protein GGTG_04640 [Gaeumannomyces tritici R3-111a-1]EJT79555.1 hypothetical protein GGTG_04640 [Gaeumannomyces tritici R3-111a-1]